MNSLRSILLILFIVGLSRPGLAQQEAREQLAEIQAKVDQQDQLLEGLQSEKQRLEVKSSSVRQDLKQLNKEASELDSRAAVIDVKQAEVKKEISRLAAEIIRLRGVIGSRLRSLYFSYKQPSVNRLLNISITSDFVKNTYYLSKITSFDRGLLVNLDQSQQSYEERRLELEAIAKEHGVLRQKLKRQKGEIAQKLEELNATLSELSKKEEQLEDSLATLRAQALRVETVVVSLTEGTKVKPEKRKQRVAPIEDKSRQAAPFKGRGLFVQKGSLSLPVRGSVLTAFGKRRHKEFKDFVFHKGLEFVVEGDLNVRAIAKGKVRYVGRLPGYGTVLILDHGERYYSLYGRLESVDLEPGMIVERGEIVAGLSAITGGGGNFYFEIRKSSGPVNPQNYYSKRFKVLSGQRH